MRRSPLVAAWLVVAWPVVACLVLPACADEPRAAVVPAPPEGASLADLGPVEWPGPALREPVPWLALSLGGVVVAAAIVLLLVARTRRPPAVEEPPAAPRPEAPPPEDAALRRLAALRATDPADGAAVLAFHVEAAAALREYAGARFGVRAAEMTTEELAAALPDDRGAAAGAPLLACDLVKFARARPDGAARTRLLDAVEVFVRESAA